MLNFIVTLALTVLFIAFSLRLPRYVQSILTDVGEGLTTDLSNLFEKPNVKKAFTVLADKSHDARASKTARKKAAEAIISQIPMGKMVLEQIGISAEEGLQLLNDPVIGQTLRGFIQTATSKLAQGTTQQTQNTPSNDGAVFNI